MTGKMAKYKLVFIGNSIVKGFPHRRSQCFVSLVREELGVEAINKGENGQTTDDILRRFGHDVVDHSPDTVLILTGTNDFIYGQATVGDCMENLRIMAGMAKVHGIKPVLLTPILTDPVLAGLHWMAGSGVDYEEVNRMLTQLSAQMLAYEREGDAAAIDLQGEFSAFARKAGAETAYHDGVHPSAAGQRALFESIQRNFFKVIP